MVLVTATWRRRGIATRLVDACLNAATKLGLTSWLDATPAGAGVYGPLGFTPTLQLRRLRLQNSRKGRHAAPRCRPATSRDFIARDRQAMGFDRSAAADGVCRAHRLPPACRAVTPSRWSATAAPRAISARSSLRAAESALGLVDAIVRSEQGPWLLDAVAFAGRIPARPHRRRLDHRAAVSAHAVRPRHHYGRGAAVRRRRPGIWIGFSPCTTARSNPRSGS